MPRLLVFHIYQDITHSQSNQIEIKWKCQPAAIWKKNLFLNSFNFLFVCLYESKLSKLQLDGPMGG